MRVFIRLVSAALAASAALATHAVAQTATGEARALQGVNIRTGNSNAFPIVGTLRGGEVVGLAACSLYWCRLADGRGWVSRQYLAIGSEPAAASWRAGDPAPVAHSPAIPAPFTGAWTVVPTPIDAEEAHAPFQLIIAQAGTIIEGVADGRRIEGTAAGREATFAMTAADGKRLDGKLTVEDGDNGLSGILLSDGAPILLWRAMRTTLTR